MRLILTLSILAVPLALGACKTTVQDGPTKVSVEGDHHGDGDFCPPGHAKKGWC